MSTILLVHIAAGAAALVTGLAALAATKGARVHRKAGTLFVYAMLVMGLTGAAVAAITGSGGSVIGGLLAAYMVLTGYTTLRPPSARLRTVNAAAVAVALPLGLACLVIVATTLARGSMTHGGVPVPMILLFGTVSLTAAAADIRQLRTGPLIGRARLRRHLRRMCFALFIASGSFFLGQADEIPASLRIWPVLTVLALLPLLVMPYWLWRMRNPRRAHDRPAAAALPRAGGAG